MKDACSIFFPLLAVPVLFFLYNHDIAISFFVALPWHFSCFIRMKITISGAEVYLEGDWILADVTQSAIDSLAVALQQLEAVGAIRIDIDCRQVNAIDTTGQQILYVWLECLRLQGVEPELVNFPKNLQKFFKAWNSYSSDPADPSTPTQGKAGRTTWPPTAISASSMRSVVDR